jgi:hypothetical protein
VWETWKGCEWVWVSGVQQCQWCVQWGEVVWETVREGRRGGLGTCRLLPTVARSKRGTCTTSSSMIDDEQPNRPGSS